MRSKQRQEILELLRDPNTPSSVAEEIDTHISQASRSLCKFREKDLAKVLNDDAKKGRLYTLTEEGHNILEQLNSSEAD